MPSPYYLLKPFPSMQPLDKGSLSPVPELLQYPSPAYAQDAGPPRVHLWEKGGERADIQCHGAVKMAAMLFLKNYV